jgi:hypothetical protein
VLRTEDKNTYTFEHGAPPSLAIAQRRRLPDVTLPIVPFTKQMAKAQLITVPAARLPVAWMISSISGFPVRVVRMASGFGMQKSKTTIIVRPLFRRIEYVSVDLFAPVLPLTEKRA